MSKTILVVGYGPGISSAVAERFGAAGFSVALVARNQEKLTKAVKALEAKGIWAGAFPADAGDPNAIRRAVEGARAALGPIAVVHWNAYDTSIPGDLIGASPEQLRRVFEVPVVGLLATVEAALPDLKSAKDGAVLVTNGAFGDIDPDTDAFAAKSGYMGLALANAAKVKLVGLLSERLRTDGVYVGEVMVAGTIKGSAWDQGDANLAGATVADAFFDLYTKRKDIRRRVS
jgi:NAD(P)-dependent dehydrogenase (short-subunit alcohol dehydrogenase family)